MKIQLSISNFILRHSASALWVALLLILITAVRADTHFSPPGTFGIVMDGSDHIGLVKSISGGIIKGEVATHNLGPENLQKKHLLRANAEPFIVETGIGMSEGLYDWVRQSFENGGTRRSGAIIAADFDFVSLGQREFIDAQISEVTIPALDGSSKEPAYMTIRINPEKIFYATKGSTKLISNRDVGTKKWLSSNFRFELDGIPFSRVAKIDSFTWKQAVTKSEKVGEFREPTKHPAKIEIPNLKLTISTADIKPWIDWYKSFVIDGHNSDIDELDGALFFLAPDMQEELASIGFHNVGIISLEPETSKANKEEVSRFTVELYVEKMDFEYRGE